jgi:hypothetical protein
MSSAASGRLRNGPDRKPGFWDNVAALAEGFAAAGEAGSQSVTVRIYDAAGNFTGTQTMTRARAIARGVRWSPDFGQGVKLVSEVVPVHWTGLRLS